MVYYQDVLIKFRLQPCPAAGFTDCRVQDDKIAGSRRLYTNPPSKNLLIPPHL
jgi:hypothetical protein